MEVISHAVDNTSILYIAGCYMHMQHGITVLSSTSRQIIRAVLLYGILGMRNVKMKMKKTIISSGSPRCSLHTDPGNAGLLQRLWRLEESH